MPHAKEGTEPRDQALARAQRTINPGRAGRFRRIPEHWEYSERNLLPGLFNGLVGWAKQTVSLVGRRPLHVHWIDERRAICRGLDLRRSTSRFRGLVPPPDE